MLQLFKLRLIQVKNIFGRDAWARTDSFFSLLVLLSGYADLTRPKGWHLSSPSWHGTTRASIPNLVTFWPDCHSPDSFEAMGVPGTKAWVKGSLWIAAAEGTVFAQARDMHNIWLWDGPNLTFSWLSWWQMWKIGLCFVHPCKKK